MRLFARTPTDIVPIMQTIPDAPPLPEAITAYMARVQALPGVAAWVKDALAEQDFLPFEEPYRTKR